MSKAQEISNCPFCGESRAYVSDIDSAAIHMGCRGCGVQLWGKTHHFGSHAEAIAVWNRRSASSEQQAAQQDADTIALPRKEWEELQYYLDRCYDKGHLDQCFDLVEPLEALNAAIAARASNGGKT